MLIFLVIKHENFITFLHHDFPLISKIISYGSAQSNAMYSLSVLAKMRGWEFEYYISHIATYLKDNPHGNYKASLDNGMKIHSDKKLPNMTKETLFIEEGGRQKEAKFGLDILAEEIGSWTKRK